MMNAMHRLGRRIADSSAGRRVAASWLNWTVTWKVYQVIATMIVLGILGLFIVQQIETNDARDRERDLIAGIDRSYQADLRAWEAEVRQHDLCEDRAHAQDAVREGLLGQNGLLRSILQIIEGANPTTEVFGPLFAEVDVNRAAIERDYAPFPPCAPAPSPPARPPELGPG